MRALDLEERIINGSALIAVISIFMPWTSGFMLGSDPVSYSGIGFYTSFIGIGVLLLNAYILLMTLVPLTGGPSIVRKRNKDRVRLICSVASTVLVLAALSVLMRVTFQFSRMEIRFGINVAMIASMVVTLYTYLRVQQQRKSDVEEIFQNPMKEEQKTGNEYTREIVEEKVEQIKEPKSPIITSSEVPRSPEPEEHRFTM